MPAPALTPKPFAVLRALLLAAVLMTTLTQCRVWRACVKFFKDHASTGHHPPGSTSPPASGLTVEQFIRIHARRGIPEDVLRTRFRVADLNGNGLLTQWEIEKRQKIAAENKKKRGEG